MRHGAAIALALALGAGCTRSESSPATVVAYDPYDGAAPFPNRRPKLALPHGDLGLTVDIGSDTISVVDFVGGKVVRSAPVGRDPVDIDGPHDLAVDELGGFVYVVLSYPAPAQSPGPHAAHGASARSGFLQKLALDDLRILGEVRLEPNAGELHMSDDRSRIVATHFDLRKAILGDGGLDAMRASIAVIDPTKVLASGSPDPVFIPTCVAPHDVALSSPDGKTAYVACYGEDAIAVVDTSDPSAPILRVPVGGAPGEPAAPLYGPYVLEMSPSGKTIYVGNTESKDVRFFDVASRSMSSTIVHVQAVPAIASYSDDEATLWVATQSPDQLLAIDTASGAVTNTRVFDAKTCLRPHAAVLGGDPSAIYVVCEGDHAGPGAILVVDRATFATRATYPVGVYPNELEILEGE